MDAANSELSDLKKQISLARVEERKASVALGQADALVKNLQVIFIRIEDAHSNRRCSFYMRV